MKIKILKNNKNLAFFDRVNNAICITSIDSLIEGGMPVDADTGEEFQMLGLVSNNIKPNDYKIMEQVTPDEYKVSLD